ncbi:MAG: NGG1p interacting factor NIF3 [Firmicutes bacterium]|nr:NGG1p interacting factor NIF3 [Bacillota bacterium]
MLIREIYELALQKGMASDPRGEAEVARILEKQRKEYEELKESEKKEFDLEKLKNPYSDTRILNGDEDREVRGVLSGIDIEVGEVLLADRLREKGRQIDLIISHHPEGKAMAALYEVMHLQEDILNRLGVPINVAEGILAGRIAEVARRLLPLNHNRAVDVARLLDLPLMCVHTPADNLVTKFLEQFFAEKAPETVGDILKTLKELPEYREAVKVNAGPKVLVGSEKKRAGKIFVDMTGGTGGAKEAFEKLATAGVGTVVCMHISEEHRKEAEKHHINVVVAGHIASDSLGMNLFLDELDRRGIEIFACSGLIRVSRVE